VTSQPIADWVLASLKQFGFEDLCAYHNALCQVLDLLHSATPPPAAPPPTVPAKPRPPKRPAAPGVPRPKPEPAIARVARPRITTEVREALILRVEKDGELIKNVAADLGLKPGTARLIIAKYRRDNEHG
jgi:hypothetical protein